MSFVFTIITFAPVKAGFALATAQMKQFILLIRQLFFWMVVFAVERAVFLAYYSTQLSREEIPFSRILLSFFHGLRLDLSTASYILVIPFFLLLIQGFFKAGWLNLLNRIYTFLILFLYVLVSVSEIGLFGEWKTKLSYKAILYLRHPTEVFGSVPNRDLVLFFILLVVQVAFFYLIYIRFFYRKPETINGSLSGKLAFSLLTPVLLFIGVRGGVGQISITASDSYFSKHNILNLAAVNNLYNVTFSVIDYYQIEEQNYFKFMPDDEALAIVKRIQETKTDTTINILNIKKPNIVLILLESWSADLIETLSGDTGITPRFHNLEKKGLLFTEFYASGNRTQQALGSVFSGLPALPVTTLTDHPEKYDSLPGLVRLLNNDGYYSAFYFGGDLNYGNIKSYLVYNGFDRLVGWEDFKKGWPEGKLGIHDQGLFMRLTQDMGNLPQPFFLAALTLSSHSPYDFPGPRPINWLEPETEFLNSAHYTDKWLGTFFDEVKKQSWYRNTLFILMADHSHLTHRHQQIDQFGYRNIPILFLGDALKEEYRNTRSSHLCGNADVPATLLAQLGISHEDFFWSKDMFNPYSPQFAYFELSDGFGWKRPDHYIVYNVTVPFIVSTDVPKKQQNAFLKEGQAYVQVLFGKFLSY